MPTDNIIDPTGFRKTTGYMPVSLLVDVDWLFESVNSSVA